MSPHVPLICVANSPFCSGTRWGQGGDISPDLLKQSNKTKEARFQSLELISVGDKMGTYLQFEFCPACKMS